MSQEEFDKIWSWAEKLSKLVQEVAKIKAENRRLKRNERRRWLYAYYKQHPKPKKPEPEPERDDWIETSCHCSTCGRPPCGWCTSPDRTEEDFN